MPIKVAIVEDNEETRNGLKRMIDAAPDLFCAGVFEDAESIIKIFRHLDVDIVLMDIELPGQSGIECIGQLKEMRPQVQFLVVTNYEDADKIFDALNAGATGYILKNIMRPKLLEAIKDIHAGGSPMSVSVARKIVNSISGHHKNIKLYDSLTLREKEVINLLAKGYHYKEIAQKLLVGIETVNSHIRSIYEKLHVHSRLEAIHKIFPPN